MAGTFQARGQHAALKVGYQQAAVLGPWTLEGSSTGWAFTASVVSRDDLWCERRPLTLALEMGSREWRWRGCDDVTFDEGGRVTVVGIGRPEIR